MATTTAAAAAAAAATANTTTTTTSSTSSLATTIQNTALSGLGNLIRLLPTGTVFMFHFLNPVFTNNGQCHTLNRILCAILIELCGLSCAFSSFTDSYIDDDGDVQYGISTINGIWPSPPASVDASQYKISIRDFVHAFFVLLVFAVVVLFDKNTVECFYPGLEIDWKLLMTVLPPAVGAISGLIFMISPATRHGIGYPLSTDTTTTQSSK